MVFLRLCRKDAWFDAAERSFSTVVLFLGNLRSVPLLQDCSINISDFAQTIHTVADKVSSDSRRVKPSTFVCSLYNPEQEIWKRHTRIRWCFVLMVVYYIFTEIIDKNSARFSEILISSQWCSASACGLLTQWF